MIGLLLHLLLALCSPRTANLADGVLRTAPAYVTADTAQEHARAALAAGSVYRVDPAILLSIAHHESRYQVSTVTPEVGGGASCGVMTPEPLRARQACLEATSSLLSGYLAGARHLRVWMDACHGNERCALLGYAGGYRLISLCSRRDVRACHTPEVFEARAARIRRPRPGV